MSLPRKLFTSFFPARASTQTWMILTFALFVGMAVLTVGLYVTFVLRSEAAEAVRQTLYARAERVAAALDAEVYDSGRRLILRDASRVSELRFVFVRPDGVRYGYENGQPLVRVDRVVPAFEPGQTRAYVPVDDPDGRRRVHYAALKLASGGILEVGQPEPPLYALIARMQVVVVVGMGMALLLSILGSWVAANQVTRPLRQIRDSASAILEGDYGEKIAIESRAAEFLDVASHLNRMSDSFRAKIGDLERLAHIQSEFIGNVSHEVRNPIFAVGGYLEALGSPTLPPEQRAKYAEKGLAALSRLQNLFNDLIEIAKLEYREDLIRATDFDLQGLLEEVAEMLRPKAEEKGLKLVLHNPPTLVHADRNRMRQVLTNLVENAIAYTDEGTVRCRFRRRLDKVRVEVIDSGRGIPEESLERIFERFYRVDPDRSRKSGGTGLGLSIVKQILQAHGEQIRVESTLGRGTRFWFELPYAGEAEPALHELSEDADEG